MAYKGMKLPELLAPAGGMEQLKAALRFGDYIGYVGAQRSGNRKLTPFEKVHGS